MLSRFLSLSILALLLSMTATYALVTDHHQVLRPQEIETLENKQSDIYRSYRIHTLIFLYDHDEEKQAALQAWETQRLHKSRPSILILASIEQANGFSINFQRGATQIDPDNASVHLNKSAKRVNHISTSTGAALLKFLESTPDDLEFLKENAILKSESAQTEITYKQSKHAEKSATILNIALVVLSALLLAGLVYGIFLLIRKKRPSLFPLIHHQPRLGGNFAGGTNALITKDKARIR